MEYSQEQIDQLESEYLYQQLVDGDDHRCLH